MRCDEILEYLTEDEGTLAPEVRSEVARHLDGCAACCAEREQLDDAWQMLDEWPELEPSPAPVFTAAVMARVRDEATCVRSREAMLESELPADVAAHVESCAACREERDRLQQTWEMLGAWRDIEPSPTFTADVMRKVRATPTLVAPGVMTPRRGFRMPSSRFVRTFATLAAVFAMMAGVLFLLKPHTTSPEGPRVLDQYVRTFDAGTRVTVIDELPNYVAATDGDVLEDIKDPSGEDDVLEQVLNDRHPRRGGEG